MIPKIWLYIIMLAYANALFAGDSDIGVFVDRTRLVKQGYMECGPTSLFNALALSATPFNEALNRLAGNDPRSKYQSLLSTVALKVSQFQRAPRLDSGTNLENLYFMARDLLSDSAKQKLWGAWLLREENKADGELLERATRYIRRSLLQGLPPILLIKRTEWEINAIDDYGHPIKPIGHYAEQKVGHFVLVTGINWEDPHRIRVRIFNPFFREDDLVIEDQTGVDQPPAFFENFVRLTFNYQSEADLPQYIYRDVERPTYSRLSNGNNSPYLIVNSPTFTTTDQPANFNTDPLFRWPAGTFWGQVNAELPKGPRYYYRLEGFLGAR